MGIARGVNEISERFLISSFTLSFFIPLCLLNSPVNNAKPDDTIIGPQAILKKFNVIQKNDRINFPTKNEISNIIKTFGRSKTLFYYVLIYCVLLLNQQILAQFQKGSSQRILPQKSLQIIPLFFVVNIGFLVFSQ